MAVIKKTKDKSMGENMEELEPLQAVGGKAEWGSHYEKQCEGSSTLKNKMNQ